MNNYYHFKNVQYFTSFLLDICGWTKTLIPNLLSDNSIAQKVNNYIS